MVTNIVGEIIGQRATASIIDFVQRGFLIRDLMHPRVDFLMQIVIKAQNVNLKRLLIPSDIKGWLSEEFLY